MSSDKNYAVVVDYPSPFGCYFVSSFGKEYHENPYFPRMYSYKRAKYVAMELNKQFKDKKIDQFIKACVVQL